MTHKITKMADRFSLKSLLIVAVSLAILVVFLIKISQPGQNAQAAWYNDSWAYRQAINISAHTAAETNAYFTVTINIGSTAKVKTDDSDFRFTNVSGQLTPYYISSGAGTTNVTFHVFVNIFPAGAQTFYAYYGNLQAVPGNQTTDFTTAATGVTLASNSTEEKSPSPLAWWKFDEGVGTTVNNAGIGGTLYGVFGPGTSAPTWTSEPNCISGKCLSFNGANYINAGNTVNLSGNTDMTLEAWVKPSSLPASKAGIISKYNDGVAGEWYLALDNNGHYGFERECGSFTANSTYITPLNQWVHVVAVYASGKKYIYINGKLDSTATDSCTISTSSAEVMVGADDANTNAQKPFTGLIDEVKIYAYARTNAQVLADYNTIASSTAKGNNALLGANRDSNQPVPTIASKGSYTFPSGTTRIGTGTTFDGYDITVPATAQVFFNGNHTFSSVTINTGGTLDVDQYGDTDINKGKLTITANTITVQSSGNITASGRGYGGGGGGGGGPLTTGGNGNSLTNNGLAGTCGTAGDGGGFGGGGGGGATVGIQGGNGYYGAGLGATGAATYGGGGGGGEINSCPASNGSSGTGGLACLGASGAGANGGTASGGFCDDQAGGGGGGGGGPFGGVGGTGANMGGFNGTNGSKGGYKAVGTNGDTTTDFSADMGSGGGGGGGGGMGPGCFGVGGTGGNGGALGGVGSCALGGGGSNTRAGGGGGGGAGGGSIILNALTSITVAGTIDANGAGDAALSGGYGSGGGIAIKAPTINLTSATIKSLGGNNLSHGVTTNGGTIKIFTANYTGSTPNTTNFPSGRVYFASSNQSLAGYWKFDEGVGNSVYDSSGNNYNAGWSGTPSWGNGKIGKAGIFSVGTSSFVVTSSTIPYAPTISSSFTFSAWIKPSVIDGTYQNIIAGNDGTGTGRTILAIRNGDNMIHSNIGNTQTSSGVAAVANTWYHVAIVYNGSGETFYINGVGTSSSVVPIEANSGKITIGASKSGVSTFNGLIDDVRYYNYARNSKQVVEDMNAGHPGGNGPFLYYKLNEGQGTSVNNSGWCGSACNSNFGPGVSAPTWTTSGKYDKGLSFSTNQYSDASISQNLASDFTVSYWIKSANFGVGMHHVEVYAGRPLVQNTAARLLCTTLRNAADSAWVSQCTPNAVMVDNVWQHVAVTYSNSNILKIYYNGQIALSSLMPGPQGNWISPYTFKMGGRTGAFLTGSLDEVKVYNYALTDSEILQEYNQGQVLQLGSNSQNIGTTGSPKYCVIGDTTSCASPLAEWMFNEGTGTSVYDSSGNNISGFWAGTLGSQWGRGRNSTVGNFYDANSNYVNASTSTALSLQTQTITGWIYLSSQITTITPIIFSRSNGIVSGGYEWGVRTATTTPHLAFAYFDGAVRGWYADSATLTKDTWHFIAGEWDKTGGTVTFYIDGVKGTPVATTTGTITNIAGDSNLIGYQPDNNYWYGKISQLRVYNYLRTPAQIAWEYNRGAPLSWFKFDECQGSGVYDAINVGTTGTIIIGASGTQSAIGTCANGVGSTTAWGNGSTGKLNSSLSFDGTDDYITTSINTGSMDYTKPYTLASWVYVTGTSLTKQFILSNHISNPSGTTFATYLQAYANAGTNTFSVCSGKDTNAYAAGADCASTTNPFNLNNWYHLVGVADGTKLTLYVNGINIAQTTFTAATTGASASNRLWTIGDLRSDLGGDVDFFTGKIDDVRVYNYALTASQVQTLYNENAAVRFGP